MSARKERECEDSLVCASVCSVCECARHHASQVALRFYFKSAPNYAGRLQVLRMFHVLRTLITSVPSPACSKVSRLNLVDLAGSERITRSGVEGRALKEVRMGQTPVWTFNTHVLSMLV